MRRVLTLSVVALALTALTAGALYAADAKATGTVTGKVVDKDGKAVSGAMVAAMLPPPPKGEKGEKKEGAENKEAKKEAMQERVLVQTTSAADGTFTLASVPEGKVIVVARKPGTGVARNPVEVKAGETTTLSAPLTLAKPAEGEHKGEHKKEKK